MIIVFILIMHCFNDVGIHSSLDLQGLLIETASVIWRSPWDSLLEPPDNLNAN